MNYAADGSPIRHSIFSCLRKKKYFSEPDAWSAIFRMRARNQDTERLMPYRCDSCRDWHLGRVPTRMQSELNAAK